MLRNKTARQHNFATVPRADIPRSKFRMRQTRKQAFNASHLIPIMCEEVLPGDVWQHRENIVARLAPAIAPIIDDLDLETFYFYIPNRITWRGSTQKNRWEQFISGQEDLYTIPTISPTPSIVPDFPVPVGSVADHFGIAPGTYDGSNSNEVWNALPFWAYFTVYNEWFRDQNLQNEWKWDPDWNGNTWDNIEYEATPTNIAWDGMPLRANKRHDYFTSSLPWPQKGDAVLLPLGTSAPVIPVEDVSESSLLNIPHFVSDSVLTDRILQQNSSATVTASGAAPAGLFALKWGEQTGLKADLQDATSATINAIRLAFQTQKLLERDARGGSRYVEQLLAHFGVRSPDYRLNRPEYLGGSKIPVAINPVAQTAAYDAEPAMEASPLGNLGGEMHATGSKRTFTYAATEHGYIIGLALVRATPTYQQGLRKHWLRETRLDFYFPAFAMLGEQAVQTREIYNRLAGAYTNATWGYQERWAEYRYTPNEITGVLRSTASQPLDWWHLAEEFENEPALNREFIEDKTYEVLGRALAIDTDTSQQWSAQIIMDILHDSVVARLMPVNSVPGLIDHF